MSDSPELTDRIVTLETRIAFQDQAIEELNTALAEHFREIEALKRDLHNMGALPASVRDADLSVGTGHNQFGCRSPLIIGRNDRQARLALPLPRPKGADCA